MTLSPILKERIAKFKRSKRAYWSLILIVLFFLLSLPAELFCNDKPYVIKYKGKLYWPIFVDYTKSDFGMTSELSISDYQDFLEDLALAAESESVPSPEATDTKPAGDRDKDMLEQLYGDDSEELDLEELETDPEDADKSKNTGDIAELFGDDNESLDIEELARRQDEGEDVLQTVGKPSVKTEMDRLVYQLYGDDNEDVDIQDLARRQDAGENVYDLPEGHAPPESGPKVATSVWALWPPIRYNARTKNDHHTTERGHLISPTRYVSEVTGEEVPGAIEDGHFLGTDAQGRDVLARLVYGFRVSLVFGFGLALTGTIIGCLLGGLQGYFGGMTDLFGQRATEIWGSMPRLFLLIILSSFLATQRQLTGSQHFALLFGILNLTTWMGMASHMRAQFLRARNLDYVKAAKALGQSNFKIMMKHILPNSLVPVVTFVPFAIAGGISALVSLVFLGFGVKYPAPSLGNLLAQGHETMKWWIIVPTFIIFSVTLILLTFVGEGVRNAFDPRHKG